MTKCNGTKFLPHNSISLTFWTIFFTENIGYPFNIFSVIGTWGTKYLNHNLISFLSSISESFGLTSGSSSQSFLSNPICHFVITDIIYTKLMSVQFSKRLPIFLLFSPFSIFSWMGNCRNNCNYICQKIRFASLNTIVDLIIKRPDSKFPRWIIFAPRELCPKQHYKIYNI